MYCKLPCSLIPLLFPLVPQRAVCGAVGGGGCGGAGGGVSELSRAVSYTRYPGLFKKGSYECVTL